jgi:hypothetical protein
MHTTNTEPTNCCNNRITETLNPKKKSKERREKQKSDGTNRKENKQPDDKFKPNKINHIHENILDTLIKGKSFQSG